MNKRNQITSFFVEALLLILIFLTMLLVLTRTFVQARSESLRAEELTCGVKLAENAAEAVSASRSEEELLYHLDGDGSAEATEGGVIARYGEDMIPDPAGPYEVLVTWVPESVDRPALVNSTITVRCEKRTVYTLETSVFCPAETEGGAAT